jgi:hypothetical protein
MSLGAGELWAQQRHSSVQWSERPVLVRAKRQPGVVVSCELQRNWSSQDAHLSTRFPRKGSYGEDAPGSSSVGRTLTAKDYSLGGEIKHFHRKSVLRDICTSAYCRDRVSSQQRALWYHS